MDASYLNSALRSLAVVSITGYQKYISPYKGFSCALRVLYGGESCSQYIKNVIATRSLVTAIQLSRQRLKSCRDAYKILDRQPLNLNDYPTAFLDGCDCALGDSCDLANDSDFCNCGLEDFIDESWFKKKQQKEKESNTNFLSRYW